MLSSDRPVHFKPVKYVIFDLDGTLIDSEISLKRSNEEMLQKFGIDYTDELRLKLTGRAPKLAYELLVEEYGLDESFEEFMNEREIQMKKYLTNVNLMPGAEDLVNWLHERDIPFAIATSSSREEVEFKTKHLRNFFNKFRHVSTRDDVEEPKPRPEVFLDCASRFIPLANPSEVLVFEDSLVGLQGARTAGMQVVLLADPAMTAEQKSRATTTISCLSEFDPREFKLSAWS